MVRRWCTRSPVRGCLRDPRDLPAATAGWRPRVGPDPARSAQGGARAHLMAFVPGREANPGSFSSVVFIVWLFQWIKGRNLKISMF